MINAPTVKFQRWESKSIFHLEPTPNAVLISPVTITEAPLKIGFLACNREFHQGKRKYRLQQQQPHLIKRNPEPHETE